MWPRPPKCFTSRDPPGLAQGPRWQTLYQAGRPLGTEAPSRELGQALTFLGRAWGAWTSQVCRGNPLCPPGTSWEAASLKEPSWGREGWKCQARMALLSPPSYR